MDKPIYIDEPPRVYGDPGGMMHVVFRSSGEDVAHFVMDRLNFVRAVETAEHALDPRRGRDPKVTPLRPRK